MKDKRTSTFEWDGDDDACDPDVVGSLLALVRYVENKELMATTTITRSH